MEIIKTQETLHKEKYEKFRDKVIKKIKNAGYFIDNMSSGNICIQKEKGIFKKSYFLYICPIEIELRIPKGHDTNQEDIKFFESLEKKTGLKIIRYI